MLGVTAPSLRVGVTVPSPVRNTSIYSPATAGLVSDNTAPVETWRAAARPTPVCDSENTPGRASLMNRVTGLDMAPLLLTWIEAIPVAAVLSSYGSKAWIAVGVT